MTLSLPGVRFIEALEGFRPKAYQDSGGVWTIGYGTTRGVKEGDTITNEEAEKRLLEDSAKAAGCINSNVTSPLSQNEFDALVSFVYNVGCHAFITSTLLRRINAGERQAAANEFGKWIFVSSQKSEGLANRRRAERLLYLGDAG